MDGRTIRERFSLEPAEAGSGWFRGGLVLFSLLLIAQAIWILLAELQHSRLIRFPVDERTRLEAAQYREEAGHAAKLAVVRGDLWAESAFTYSALLWPERANPDLQSSLVDEARTHLERAVRFSPLRGDVWLLLAAMEDRHDRQRDKPLSLLKMSYYTAPNEPSLFLPRIEIALRSAALQDPELADMIGRDIRVLVTRIPMLKPGLIALYRAAPAPDKLFIERVISGVDPTYLAEAAVAQ